MGRYLGFYIVKQGVALIKFLVLLSSLLLAGGYVFFQAGGGLFPSSKSGRAVWERGQREEQTEEQPSTPAEVEVTSQPSFMSFLPGSKSMIIPGESLWGRGQVVSQTEEESSALLEGEIASDPSFMRFFSDSKSEILPALMGEQGRREKQPKKHSVNPSKAEWIYKPSPRRLLPGSKSSGSLFMGELMEFYREHVEPEVPQRSRQP
jgi:hypothetical protein